MRATGRQNPSTTTLNRRDAKDPERIASVASDAFLWTRNALDQIRSFVLRDVQVQIPDRWIAPTLLNSWDFIDYDAIMYRSPDGFVQFRGTIYAGTYGASPIFALPTGWTVAAGDLRFAAYQSNATYEGAGVVVVGSDGNVYAPTITSVQTGVSIKLSLDTVRFQADDCTPATLAKAIPVDLRGLTATPSDVSVVDCWQATGNTPFPLPRIAWNVYNGLVYITQVADLPPGLYNLRLLIVAEPS